MWGGDAWTADRIQHLNDVARLVAAALGDLADETVPMKDLRVWALANHLRLTAALLPDPPDGAR